MFFGAYWTAGMRESQSILLNNDLLEPVSQRSETFSTKSKFETAPEGWPKEAFSI